MSKVILICGKICSGKSYYANILKEKENAVILSTDEVTYDLTNNKQGEEYDEFATRVNNYLKKKALEIVKAGCNVILDWGFWTEASRREITQYFKSNNVDVNWHYICVDNNTWNINIKERNERVLLGQGKEAFYVDEGLINKLNSKFEPPLEANMDVVHKVER